MWDIIVIGAGPASASFGSSIASSGLKVMIIDGQTEDRPKPCGGLLAPDAQKILARFDFTLPKSVLADPQIFSVKTMDLETRQVRFYQRYYLNMDRLAFDRLMLSHVPESITIVKGRCLKIDRCEKGFLLHVLTPEGAKSFKTRRIVGADGSSSIVRRTFFPDKKIMKYVAIQQWFQYKNAGVPFYSCIFDQKTSESCSWIIHKNSSLIYGGCFAPKNCRRAFEEQKKRLMETSGLDLSSPVRTEACLASRPRSFRDFVTGKDGIYLIGEAAGFISPSSFEGISSAIKSGHILARAFNNAGTCENRISATYRRNALGLKMKLILKTKKRWFMYTPWVRHLIMKTGLNSIKR